MKNRKIETDTELSEAMASTKIDKEKGIIENVLILTGDKRSRNNTLYTKKVLQEAVARYEGAKMFLDHPKTGESVRSVRDFGGTYRNVRLEEGKYLRADLHLLNKEEVRNTVIPIAESKPAGVGLSIRDKGHGREENGVFLVEGFAGKGPFSVDLVMEASVNETLFESTKEEEDMDKKEMLKSVTLEELQEGAPALVDAIKSTERAAALKEVEEQITTGKDAAKVFAKAKKLVMLAESGLPKEVSDRIKPLIEGDLTSPETAEALIKAQKEIVESLGKAPGKGKEPLVRGNGAREQDLGEGELPKPEELAEALQG